VFRGTHRQRCIRRGRRALWVVLGVWLSAVLQPCAMALPTGPAGSEHEAHHAHFCPHCPPAQHREHSGHSAHAHADADDHHANASSAHGCDGSDCSPLDRLARDTRGDRDGDTHHPDKTMVALPPAAQPDWHLPVSQARETLTAAQPLPTPHPPLYVLHCAYLK